MAIEKAAAIIKTFINIHNRQNNTTESLQRHVLQPPNHHRLGSTCPVKIQASSSSVSLCHSNTGRKCVRPKNSSNYSPSELWLTIYFPYHIAQVVHLWRVTLSISFTHTRTPTLSGLSSKPYFQLEIYVVFLIPVLEKKCVQGESIDYAHMDGLLR